MVVFFRGQDLLDFGNGFGRASRRQKVGRDLFDQRE